MLFIFLVESAYSAVDLFFKPAKVSPSCLGGSSWRAGSTEVKEPRVISPLPSDIQQDTGEFPALGLKYNHYLHLFSHSNFLRCFVEQYDLHKISVESSRTGVISLI